MWPSRAVWWMMSWVSSQSSYSDAPVVWVWTRSGFWWIAESMSSWVTNLWRDIWLREKPSHWRWKPLSSRFGLRRGGSDKGVSKQREEELFKVRILVELQPASTLTELEVEWCQGDNRSWLELLHRQASLHRSDLLSALVLLKAELTWAENGGTQRGRYMISVCDEQKRMNLWKGYCHMYGHFILCAYIVLLLLIVYLDKPAKVQDASQIPLHCITPAL